MKNKVAYILLIPVTISFFLFSIVPIIIVSRLSFFQTNYIIEKFVGFANYLKIFTDPEILSVIANSFLYVIFLVGGGTLFVLTTCLMIIDMSKRVHDMVRFLFYIPVFTAGIIISTVWRWILHPRSGLLNWLIGLMGIQPIVWLGYRYLSIALLCLMLIMSNSGGSMIIYLAAMLSIPSTIFDSAKIDGASNWQIKTRIILPIITPTIFLFTLVGMVGAFQIWETIFIMRPVVSANNLMFDIYLTGFTFSNYGLAAAKSIVLMLIIMAFSITKRKIEKRSM